MKRFLLVVLYFLLFLFSPTSISASEQDFELIPAGTITMPGFDRAVAIKAARPVFRDMIARMDPAMRGLFLWTATRGQISFGQGSLEEVDTLITMGGLDPQIADIFIGCGLIDTTLMSPTVVPLYRINPIHKPLGDVQGFVNELSGNPKSILTRNVGTCFGEIYDPFTGDTSMNYLFSYNASQSDFPLVFNDVRNGAGGNCGPISHIAKIFANEFITTIPTANYVVGMSGGIYNHSFNVTLFNEAGKIKCFIWCAMWNQYILTKGNSIPELSKLDSLIAIHGLKLVTVSGKKRHPVSQSGMGGLFASTHGLFPPWFLKDTSRKLCYMVNGEGDTSWVMIGKEREVLLSECAYPGMVGMTPAQYRDSLLYQMSSAVAATDFDTTGMFKADDGDIVNGFKVYPNPAQGWVTVDFENQDITWCIVSMQGVAVNPEIFQGTRTISTDDIPNGVYLIRLLDTNAIAPKRLVIMH